MEASRGLRLLEVEAAEEQPVERPRGTTSKQRSRAIAAVAAATALCAAGALALLCSSKGGRIGRAPKLRELLSGVEWEKEHCQTYRYLKFKETLYSNLEEWGPDKGQGEGMVLRAVEVAQGKDLQPEQVLVTVNSTSLHYKPFRANLNGLEGGYGMINLLPGSSGDFKFHFYREADHKRRNFHGIAVTFYDLDTGPSRHGKPVETVESIQASGFTQYHVSRHSEVHAEQLGHGVTEFSGTQPGTHSDNSADGNNLSPLQWKRAVTLVYHNASVMNFKFSVSEGKSPRSFYFTFRPSMLCRRQTLPDLVAEAPLQHAIVAGDGLRFWKYEVKVGDTVTKYQEVAWLKHPDGKPAHIHTPLAGKVVALHGSLVEDDDLDLWLENKTFMVIEMPSTEALPTSDEEGVIVAGMAVGSSGSARSAFGAGASGPLYFDEYLKSVGDVVHKGDGIAVATDGSLQKVTIRAEHSGIVSSRHETIYKGEPLAAMKDHELMVLERFPALGAYDGGHIAALVHGDVVLKEYKVKVGDDVKINDVVAIVAPVGGGGNIEVKAMMDGIVSALQPLMPGEACDRFEGNVLATVGKFPPLTVAPGHTAISYGDNHGYFLEYMVAVGDEVLIGDGILSLTTKHGVRKVLKSPVAGVVTGLVAGLKEGMDLKRVLDGSVVASISTSMYAQEARQASAERAAPSSSSSSYGWLWWCLPILILVALVGAVIAMRGPLLAKAASGV